MISFIVPLVPPSVNHYVKHPRNGKSYRTPEATAFKDAIGIYACGASVTAHTFGVSIVVHLPKKGRGDVDNFPKLVLDGLADCGVFRDRKGKRISDAYVRRLEVDLDSETRPDEGFTHIDVWALA
jgi:crossover junction endodeoxyribonuclease RusA